MQVQDRIVDLRRVPASSLRPNPKNWRTHPEAQQNALRGVLAEVGYADALIAREVDGGDLMLIDGHLRAETSGDSLVPVLVVDVTEEEADKILASLDPLASMAGRDDTLLSELLAGIDTDNQALQTLLDDLADDNWFGQNPVDPEAIGEYDPDSETVSIRVNNVLRSDSDALAGEIEQAISRCQFSYEVSVM